METVAITIEQDINEIDRSGRVTRTIVPRYNSPMNNCERIVPEARFLAPPHFSAVARVSLLALWCGILLGCDRGGSAMEESEPQMLPVVAALGAPPGEVVLAQGQLEPARGVIPIIATQGDRIEQISVAAGDSVTAGMVVGRLAGRAARQAELAVAEIQLAEARERRRAAAATAKAELEVAAVGVKRNERQLRQAEESLARAQAPGGELELLERRLRLAQEKLDQLRQAAAEPDSRRLVGATAVQQQELAVEAARAELESARREAEGAAEAAQLALEAAEKELRAAELAIESASATAPLESLEKQVELLELQVQQAELTSPISGIVLAVDMSEGEPTTGRPVMRVADTSQMICRAEVPVAELPRIAIGAEAKMTGGGLGEPISGRVGSISRVIGSPRLPSPSPLSRVDWRAADVVIDVDPSDAERAAQLIHARVDVAIRARGE